MAIKITLDSFLAVIKRSNLLSEEQVNTALEKFRAAKGAVTDAKPFAEFLVRNKQLTVWQAEKVLQGKHKGFFLGRYRLLSLLGKGGMSSVYLAEHTVMKRLCALKVLPAKRVNDASYLGRFHREAQAVAALDHPNIVRAYDVDMTADAGVDIHFLAMEFVQGKSLLELVQEKGPVSVADAAEFVRQSALGLDHAHRAGLVHRDIKPGNLLITPTGTIKVLDLGLARFFDDEDHSLTVQHDEKVLGTADYISPEQAIDSHKVDRRTDIYSLGCTLYYLLSGHPPFNTGSLAQRLVAHQTKPPPLITAERADVPTDLQAIMEKMMAKKTSDRYQTAQEVSDAIAVWQKQTPVTRTVDAVVAQPKAADAKASTTPQAEPIVLAKPIASESSMTKKAKAAPPRERNSNSSGVGSKAAAKAPGNVASNESVMDSSGVEAADPLGNFLAGLSSRVNIDSEPQTSQATESQASRSSSKRLSQAAVETGKLTAAQTEVAVNREPPYQAEAELSGMLEQVFDPELLDLVDSDEEIPVLTDPVPESPVTRPSVLVRDKTTKPIAGQKSLNPKWLTIGGVVVLLGAIGVYLYWGSSPNPPVIAPHTKPTKSLPAATLAVIEVGPEGHFTTISQAVEFVRHNFRPLNADETRTIQVTGGFTYPESINIVSGGRTHFPRNVILKSTGASPAVLQGDGTQPVLNIQETESLTIEGFVIDARNAAIAVRINGFSPRGRVNHLQVRNFSQVGVLLDNVAAQTGEEFQLNGVQIQGASPEAVGLRCQAPGGGTTVCVQLANLRIKGPLRAGIETSGTFWKSTITDSILAECVVGIRFGSGVLDEVSLVNNTLFQNQRGIVFTQLPEPESRNVKVYHTLFRGNVQADAVVETGDATSLADRLLVPADGRHHNRTDRKEADANGFDVFTGDGQRGVSTTFTSSDSSLPGYLKPAETDINVAAPASGAKVYVGAVAP